MGKKGAPGRHRPQSKPVEHLPAMAAAFAALAGVVYYWVVSIRGTSRPAHVCDRTRSEWLTVLPASEGGQTSLTVESRVLSSLDTGSFGAEYATAGRPVLLTGAAPAPRAARPALLAAFADQPLAMGKSTGITANAGRGEGGKMPLHEFVCEMEQRSLKAASGGETKDEEPPYIFDQGWWVTDKLEGLLSGDPRRLLST
jgi:hypothetical protein